MIIVLFRRFEHLILFLQIRLIFQNIKIMKNISVNNKKCQYNPYTFIYGME